jgi:hypothetical protein
MWISLRPRSGIPCIAIMSRLNSASFGNKLSGIGLNCSSRYSHWQNSAWQPWPPGKSMWISCRILHNYVGSTQVFLEIMRTTACGLGCSASATSSYPSFDGQRSAFICKDKPVFLQILCTFWNLFRLGNLGLEYRRWNCAADILLLPFYKSKQGVCWCICHF